MLERNMLPHQSIIIPNKFVPREETTRLPSLTTTKQATESPIYQSCDWEAYVIFIIDGSFMNEYNYNAIHSTNINFIIINIGTYTGRSISSNTNKWLTCYAPTGVGMQIIHYLIDKICLRRSNNDPTPSPTACPTASPTTDTHVYEESATSVEKPQTQIQLQPLNDINEKEYIAPCTFKIYRDININVMDTPNDTQVSGLSNPKDNKLGQLPLDDDTNNSNKNNENKNKENNDGIFTGQRRHGRQTSQKVLKHLKQAIIAENVPLPFTDKYFISKAQVNARNNNIKNENDNGNDEKTNEHSIDGHGICDVAYKQYSSVIGLHVIIILLLVISGIICILCILCIIIPIDNTLELNHLRKYQQQQRHQPSKGIPTKEKTPAKK